MQNLLIEQGVYTPRIAFDAVTGRLEITGESYMEHPIDFYQPIMSWFTEYFEHSTNPVQLHFRLKYFNTGSSKALYKIFRLLEQRISLVTVNWHVEKNDAEMLTEGEEFQEEFPNLYFNIVSK